MGKGHKKWVYLFEEGRADQRRLLGGKGANLAEMTNIGLPVPPGFTISTEACIAYYDAGGKFPEGLEDQVWERMSVVEKKTGKRFGDPSNPLLVSVRSGAMVSMPGMMDTILNLGLNDRTAEGLAALSGDRRFALDCYRRFIQMFGNVVLHLEHHAFDKIITARRKSAGVDYDYELDPANLEAVIAAYSEHIREATGSAFPQDPREQLRMAIQAVFASWNNDRAIVYRTVNKIPHDLGTAVNVQTMVFGNLGPDSATGVLFTRNPATGEPGVYGEYLINAQGEDVVAGIRTPQSVAAMSADMPETRRELERLCETLEKHYLDMQDIEFTVEKGRLFVLQTRSGKRTAAAAVRIGVDMVSEGLIDKEEAVVRFPAGEAEQLLKPTIDWERVKKEKLDPVKIASGLPASPGAALGRVVFTSADAVATVGEETDPKKRPKVILVRPMTNPDDIRGILAAQGVLTSQGGMTCHAAIVARQWGIPTVVGCQALDIDTDRKLMTVEGVTVRAGDLVTLDGSTGSVYLGELPLMEPRITDEFATLLGWADESRRLGVWANADNPGEAARAREYGAEGIGLCRTEHMFLVPERVPVVRRMILADEEAVRRQALDDLMPMQEDDFHGILRTMHGLPVTIRLLDPPLHEFLPHRDHLLVELTELRVARGGKGEGGAGAPGPSAAGGDAELSRKLEATEDLLGRVDQLHEYNPMMGHRGVRVGVTFPEVYEMQARAIFRAAARLVKEGVDARPEVMIPLVGIEGEIAMMRDLVVRVAEETMREFGVTFPYHVGTMIEVPRGALVADEIARHAEFFSFGTNDLTQMTFGFSRDDAEGKFLGSYLERRILRDNPFATLDADGVGRLMEMAILRGRNVREDLKVGICGEHGGDPDSIHFCHRAGLDYVSCSPFRVPTARIAAAQAAIKEERAKKGFKADDRGEK
ncbi:MAG: pyruvate, phosphate dikinase [Bacillota bacterium]|nr:MAG: pyruvate, phosphate dikinase [Bacillota bacterium]